MAVEKKDKPEPAAVAAPAKSGDDQKLIAALCYIPIFAVGFLVSLFVLLTEKKENKFLKFHAIQALFFMFCLWIALMILSMVLATVTYGIGGICVFAVMGILLLAYVVAFFYLAWQAYLGKEYEIPVLGKFARKYV
jgi:uncharacterized membrane protein